MLSKRGISQIDWVISLGIFIIYLAWFFIIIQPVFSPATKESMPADSLKQKFMAEASWQVNMTPVIILSGIDSDDEPIIMDFPFKGDPLNYAIKEVYWTIREGRLLFQADISKSPAMYSLLHSSYNYTKPGVPVSISAGENSVQSGSMSASFQEGLLRSVRYNNAIKIIDLEFAVDRGYVTTTRNDFSVDGSIASYQIIDSRINSTFYVFDEKPRIYHYIDSSVQRTVLMRYTLKKYDLYYVDGSNRGSIRYNETGCSSFDTNFIDFTEGSQGIAFLFNDEVSLRMCHDDALEVEITKDIDSSVGYFIMFHSDDENPLDYLDGYSAVFGAVNVLEGISTRGMYALQDYEVSDLTGLWNIKPNFNITVFDSSSSLLSIGNAPYSRTTVHSKQYPVWLLDQYANQTMAKINILLW